MKHTKKSCLALFLALLLGLGLLQPLVETAQAQNEEPAAEAEAAPETTSEETAVYAEDSPEPAPAEETPTPAEPEESGLRISELMHKNKATLRDEDGDFPDWIELENRGTETIALAGWVLSDGKNKAGWTLPERELAPGELLLLFADGKDRREGELHTDFSLSEGEKLYLRRPDGSVAETVACVGNTADLSLTRGEDGSFAETRWPSPGFPNGTAGYDAWQESLALPEGPLVIAEAAVYERRARFGTQYGNCDWLEIKNISEKTVNLQGWYLSDDDDDMRLFSFPKKKLKAGETLLVRCSETKSASGDSSDICTGFALSSGAEQLYLSSPDGTLIDFIALRSVPNAVSCGRRDDRGGWFYFASPTPGKKNNTGYRHISAAPVNTEPDGVFEGVKRVKVELRAEGTIYYTTDGSLPTKKSKVYEGPITLKKTTMLRAVAVEENGIISPALSLSYFINEGHTLPVLSLLTDSPSSFKSMYSAGLKNQTELGTLALYEEGGGFCIPCEVKLNGETSLVLAKKNMSVRFRQAYGAETLDYDCFGGGVTSFTNLLLRSGQDYAACIFKNELVCGLAGQATDRIFAQRYKYCVLYMNGKYNGIYALLEKSNEQMYADYTGTSRDSVTVYEAAVSERSKFYKDVIQPALSMDLRKEENYRAICEVLDIDNVIDWIIVEGWCANKDLQSGNVRYGRSTEGDGKWRFMLYDLDAVFSSTEYCFDILSGYSLQSRQVGQLIKALLKNEDFRAKLLSRAAELLNGPLSDEALLAEIDRLTELLRPEAARNHDRLNLERSKWMRNVSYLKKIITEYHWQDSCISMLCSRLNVHSAERKLYFGK